MQKRPFISSQRHFHRKPQHRTAVSGTDFIKVRFPKASQGEVLGVIVDNYGSKLLVRCLDGFTRTCRIPGKIRYKLHVKIGDVVLIKKWVVQENEKGDYLYKYTRTQVYYLIRKGILKAEDIGFEPSVEEKAVFEQTQAPQTTSPAQQQAGVPQKNPAQTVPAQPA